MTRMSDPAPDPGEIDGSLEEPRTPWRGGSVLAGMAYLLLLFSTVGCLGPAITEEAPERNLPPYIAPDFLTPGEDILRIESTDQVVLGAETLLDPNPEDRLFYAFIGERSGLIEQASTPRQATDELHDGTFYFFDPVQTEIDPCNERVRTHDDETIRLFVADRPFSRVTSSGVEVEDGGYVTVHRWTLRFRSQLCP